MDKKPVCIVESVDTNQENPKTLCGSGPQRMTYCCELTTCIDCVNLLKRNVYGVKDPEKFLTAVLDLLRNIENNKYVETVTTFEHRAEMIKPYLDLQEMLRE